VGTSFVDALRLFQDDPDTEGMLIIGEIGGSARKKQRPFIARHVTKPVAAFIAGQTAQRANGWEHAGAIISAGKGTAAEKITALKAAGIFVAQSPAEMGVTMQCALREISCRCVNPHENARSAVPVPS